MWNRHGNFLGKTKNGIETRCKEQTESMGYDNIYECIKLPYSYVEKRMYTPDFYIGGTFKYDSKKFKDRIIEIKGYFPPEDRKKMLKVRENYPDSFIGIVFSNPLKTISKQSRTTYEAWAIKNNFYVGSKLIPEEWLK